MSFRKLLSRAAIAASCALSMAHAANTFHMPAGGTSWVELSSNSCTGDCTGSPLSMGPGSFGLPGYGRISAEGSVTAYSTVLSQQVNGNTGGSTFLWGATGGTFTLHGSGASPVTVTAQMDVTGSLTRADNRQLALVNIRMGDWSYAGSLDFASYSDLNFRVGRQHGASSGGFSIRQGSAGTFDFHQELDYSMALLPGSSFNLGFRTETNLMDTTINGTSIAATSRYGFALPQGYYITGDNGFDSRTLAAVPEPETYAMLLVGLGLMGAVARKRQMGKSA